MMPSCPLASSRSVGLGVGLAYQKEFNKYLTSIRYIGNGSDTLSASDLSFFSLGQPGSEGPPHFPKNRNIN